MFTIFTLMSKKSISCLKIVVNIMLKNYRQQQLPNSSRLSRVWGDPDVHDLTLMRTGHIKRSFLTDLQKQF